MEREAGLNMAKLGKIISSFQTKDLPKLKRYLNYYKGKHDIIRECLTADVEKKPVVVNYCKNITNIYLGYLAGIDIAYQSDEEGFDTIQDVLLYNDVHSEDVEYLRDALIFGRAVEINWVDEDGEQRFKLLSPLECIDVYDDSLDRKLLYGIRFYKADFVNKVNETYFVEVYDDTFRYKYQSNDGFSSFTLLEQEPHYFGQVPMTFFSLNKDEESIFEPIMGLNDTYNRLLTDEVNQFGAFADSYMIMKGVYAEDEDLANVKERKVFMIDSDADISYLTKNMNDTTITSMLDNINRQIHKIALAPDFSDEKFMSQSGIAIRYKLIGFEDNAGAIEAQMRKALQKRVELICYVLQLKGEDRIWRDVQIVFTRNLPEDINETVNVINQLRGVVSTETLLSLLPFVKDPSAEMERVKAEQQANMALYHFNLEDSEDDEEQ